MNIVCFVSSVDKVPVEAEKLWRDTPIYIIGRTPFRGRFMHPIIPGSFVDKNGKHEFSIKWCLKNLTFEEVRPGLYRGVYGS